MYKAALLTLSKPYTRSALKPLYMFAKDVTSECLYVLLDQQTHSLSVPRWRGFISDCYLMAERVCPTLDVRLLLPNVNGFHNNTIPLRRQCEAVLHVGGVDRNREQIEQIVTQVLPQIPNTIVYLTTDEVAEYHPEESVVTGSSSWNDLALHHYPKVCLGGTFDRLHNGHKILLSLSALICSDELTVGVTDATMLKNKLLTELIQSTSERVMGVQHFLSDVKSSLRYNICVIQDPFGPAITEQEIKAIVATPETQKGCLKINEIRQEKNYPPLDIHLIDFLDEESNEAQRTIHQPSEITEIKISSSKRRLQLLGTLIRPVKCPPRSGQEPYVIGLTGGIGSGKSSLAGRLEKLGAGVVDCDKLGHEAYRPGTNCYQQVIDAFGCEIPILNDDGTINRAQLGSLIFRNPSAKRRLTSIVWPEILRLALQARDRLFVEEKKKVIIFDAAVLLDACWDHYCNEVWAAFIPKPEAIRRVMERNHLSESEAEVRVEALRSNADTIPHANVLLCTLWEYEYTQTQVEKAWNLLLQRIP